MATRVYTLDDVERLVGELGATQRVKTRNALDEDNAGAFRLAERIAANPSVFSRPAVFITALDRGEHKPPPEKQAAPVDTAVGVFKRLYHAKWNDTARVNWPHEERVDFCMDYACSEIQRCVSGPLPLNGVVQLEDDLRRELREPRYREAKA